MPMMVTRRADRSPSVPNPRRQVRRRLALHALEVREVPAVGGGFTAGGILGEYFDNPDLAGTPAFTRRDVRIDFDWQARDPGGSTSPDYRRVEGDNFSVRWTGRLIPRFTETYTFRTTSDDGVRLSIEGPGTLEWATVIDHWGPHAAEEATGSLGLIAGQTYDVRLEFYNAGGPATARLAWSSPSTPEEVIDPAVNLGVNAVTYDPHVYADATKTGRAEWGDVDHYFSSPHIPTDAAGWPLGDAGHLFWEGQDETKTGGTYLLRFKGQAEVSGWMNRGLFSAGGVEYGLTLPAGAGYDPATNTTTAEVTVAGYDLFGLNFRHTRRTTGSPENTGVTDVQFMRPVAPDSETYYEPGELFAADVKDAFSRFTTLRYLTANFNPERDWADRILPTSPKAAWADRRAMWEYEVMLANETGKDLYVTIPVGATPDYVQSLANLLCYGSDGVNPYDGPVSDPAYPGLNPNLRVYVEWGNEWWNWAFSQGGWAADEGRYNVLSSTPDGQVVNFDGLRPDGDFRRWAALRTVRASETFRSVWGDAAMGDRVRVVYEFQYDNIQGTALEGLRFVDSYFNNGDGIVHVPDPHPVSYYIWGAGGATYFGASNPRGLVTDITVPDGSFEWTRVAAGSGRPGVRAIWKFTGDAGVLREAGRFPHNHPIPIAGIGTVPTTPSGAQAMFVSGTGTATVSVYYPRAGTYAIDFRAAAEAGPDMSNPLDFYFDDERVTPRGSEPGVNQYAWRPGTGFGRDERKFVVYGTVPVHVSGPGWHTIKVVGRGRPDQTTLIDDVRVSSTDAIFASRIPGGGQAAGQVSTHAYPTQLAAQARYAQAFGLEVVAYEGGWSLGGDTESVPIQSWAKYYDDRAAGAMAQAIDAFHQAGGGLNVLGTYDQWYLLDSAHAADYPLVEGIDARLAVLPVEPTAGLRLGSTNPVTLPVSAALRGYNVTGSVRPGEWVSWTLNIPASGDYRLTVGTAVGGTAAMFVDGEPAAEGPSGSPVTRIVRLTSGTHSIRVQSAGGRFVIQSLMLDRLDTLQLKLPAVG